MDHLAIYFSIVPNFGLQKPLFHFFFPPCASSTVISSDNSLIPQILFTILKSSFFCNFITPFSLKLSEQQKAAERWGGGGSANTKTACSES